MTKAKYLVVLDYKAGAHEMFGYTDSQAKDVLEAIKEANSLFARNVYLVEIYKSVGNPQKLSKGEYIQNYNLVLESRDGWRWCLPECGACLQKRYTGGHSYYKFYI